MSTDNHNNKDSTTSENEASAKPKSKKIKIILITLLALVLAVGGGLGFLLYKKNHKTETPPNKQEEVLKQPIKTINLDKFVVNLVGGDGESLGKYLQAEIALEYREAAVEEAIKTKTPHIKNEIISILSEKSAAELTTLEAKEEIKISIQDSINEIIGVSQQSDNAKEDEHNSEEHPIYVGVSDVLFTSFIIQ